jgi:hypothetical protein
LTHSADDIVSPTCALPSTRRLAGLFTANDFIQHLEGKPMKPFYVQRFAFLFAVLLGLLLSSREVRADTIFVANEQAGTIGEYDLGGHPERRSDHGLGHPIALAASGSDLFVVSVDVNGIGKIGKYTTSGATVNAALISGLDRPEAIAVSPIPEPSSLTFFGLMLAGIGIRLTARPHRPIMFHSRPMSHFRRLS